MTLSQIGKQTVVSLLGEKRALQLYYRANRYRHYKQPFPPSYQFKTEPQVYDVPGHETFFGYHDVTPFDTDGRRLLAIAVPRHGPNSAAHIGYFDLDNGEFTHVDTTKTWNYQQGCRLQWHPTHPERILYHKLVDGSPGTILYDLEMNRKVAELDDPLFSISPDGKFGVGFHFEHLGRMRPGYGYKSTDISAVDFEHVSDRLFSVDLETGEKSVLVEVTELQESTSATVSAAYHYINYPLIAPDSSTVAFLHRWKTGRADGYETQLLTYDLETDSLTVVEDSDEVSHLAWRSPSKLLATINRKGLFNTKYVCYDLLSNTAETLEYLPPIDGHPAYTSTETLLFDTIPDEKGERHLYVCNADSRQLRHLGAIYDPKMGPERCDLHPRWDREGEFISFDSVHTGNRTICVLPIDQGPTNNT